MRDMDVVIGKYFDVLDDTKDWLVSKYSEVSGLELRPTHRESCIASIRSLCPGWFSYTQWLSKQGTELRTANHNLHALSIGCLIR